MTILLFHCILCARCFLPKSYFGIQKHISCKQYNVLLQTKTHFCQKEQYLLYIHKVYIVYINIFFFFRAGTVHTGYRGMPHLHCFCILQLVGWQALCHPGRFLLVSGFLSDSLYVTYYT